MIWILKSKLLDEKPRISIPFGLYFMNGFCFRIKIELNKIQAVPNFCKGISNGILC